MPFFFFREISRFLKLILFLSVLGLCGCVGFSLLEGSEGSYLVAVPGPFIAAASLVAEHRLWAAWALVIATPRL